MKTTIMALALTMAAGLAFAQAPAKPAPVLKEVCVKKDKKGECTEKRKVPQPTRDPVAEKKKRDAEKAAKKPAAPAKPAPAKPAPAAPATK
jgi:hypothetical protein